MRAARRVYSSAAESVETASKRAPQAEVTSDVVTDTKGDEKGQVFPVTSDVVTDTKGDEKGQVFPSLKASLAASASPMQNGASGNLTHHASTAPVNTMWRQSTSRAQAAPVITNHRATPHFNAAGNWAGAVHAFQPLKTSNESLKASLAASASPMQNGVSGNLTHHASTAPVNTMWRQSTSRAQAAPVITNERAIPHFNAEEYWAGAVRAFQPLKTCNEVKRWIDLYFPEEQRQSLAQFTELQKVLGPSETDRVVQLVLEELAALEDPLTAQDHVKLGSQFVQVIEPIEGLQLFGITLPQVFRFAVVELLLKFPAMIQCRLVCGNMDTFWPILFEYARENQVPPTFLTDILVPALDFGAHHGYFLTPERVMKLYKKTRGDDCKRLHGISVAVQQIMCLLPPSKFPLSFIEEIIALYSDGKKLATSRSPLQDWFLSDLANFEDGRTVVAVGNHLGPLDSARSKKLAASLCEKIEHEPPVVEASKYHYRSIYRGLLLIEVQPTGVYSNVVRTALHLAVFYMPSKGVRSDIVCPFFLSWNSLAAFLQFEFATYGVNSSLLAAVLRFPARREQTLTLQNFISLAKSVMAYEAEESPVLQNIVINISKAKAISWVKKHLTMFSNFSKDSYSGYDAVCHSTLLRILVIASNELPTVTVKSIARSLPVQRLQAQHFEEGLQFDNALALNRAEDILKVKPAVLMTHKFSDAYGMPRLLRYYAWLSKNWMQLPQISQKSSAAILMNALQYVPQVPRFDLLMCRRTFGLESPPELEFFCHTLREEAKGKIRRSLLDIRDTLAMATFPDNYYRPHVADSFLSYFSEGLRCAVENDATMQYIAMFTGEEYIRYWISLCRYSRRKEYLLSVTGVLRCLMPVMPESSVLSIARAFPANSNNLTKVCMNGILDALLNKFWFLLSGEYVSSPSEVYDSLATCVRKQPHKCASIEKMLAIAPVTEQHVSQLAMAFGTLNIPLPLRIKISSDGDARHQLAVWWCSAKDAMLTGDKVKREQLRNLFESKETKRILNKSVWLDPTLEERRCALQLHYMMEEMFGVSLLLPALLRRLTGRGLFQEMEDASRDLHYNLSTLLLGSGCGDLMCIGSLGGLPVAGAYSVNHMDEVTPLGLTFSVLRPFDGLVAPLASFENAKEPQWPEDTKRKIVLLASTHTDTIGPDHAEFTGPLAVWVHLLSMKGYEPKVVSHKHLVWDNVQTEGLASALFNPSIQYLHTMFDVKKPED